MLLRNRFVPAWRKRVHVLWKVYQAVLFLVWQIKHWPEHPQILIASPTERIHRTNSHPCFAVSESSAAKKRTWYILVSMLRFIRLPFLVAPRVFGQGLPATGHRFEHHHHPRFQTLYRVLLNFSDIRLLLSTRNIYSQSMNNNNNKIRTRDCPINGGLTWRHTDGA